MSKKEKSARILGIRFPKMDAKKLDFHRSKFASKMNRNDSLGRLREENFDLIIIGGGASGTGAALDAALRGLRVGLVEKGDFASQTSSKSTKLIHGGVRYLEQAVKNFDFAQLRQVRHGLSERWTLIRNAPFLARPQALATPVFSFFEGLYFSIGLKIYDAFSLGDPVPKSKWLSKNEAIKLIPNLSPKAHSAVLYFDGQLDDARYALLLAKTSSEKGAAAANHLEILGFEKDENGKICRAEALDRLSGERFWIRSRRFLNCTGPFADRIRSLANPVLEPRISMSKGSHALFPLTVFSETSAGKAALPRSKFVDYILGTALLIPKTRDGRVVFAIPFEGKLMVGTTDTPYSSASDEPFLDRAEAEFLVETLNRYLEKPTSVDQIEAGFAGLRPLISMPAKRGETKSLLRDHEVEVDADSGLVSLLGGKWTTYRLMAKDAIDEICKQLKINELCTTAGQKLAGGEDVNEQYSNALEAQCDDDPAIAGQFSWLYGDRAIRVAALKNSIQKPFEKVVEGWPFVRVEVVYQVREEMACGLRDVLARRWRLEILDWKKCREAAPVVAEILATELGWSAEKMAAELAAYFSFLDSMRAEIA